MIPRGALSAFLVPSLVHSWSYQLTHVSLVSPCFFGPYRALRDKGIIPQYLKGDGMERRIRVLVANRPKLMREIIIETFVDQPDIEIVGEVGDDGDILGFVRE